MTTNPFSSLPALLTIKDVSAHCKVSDRQVRRWIKAGLLPTHQVGRRHRIAENDLALFLATHRKCS